MAFYNLSKRADRDQMRADRRAELAAVESGEWPRDINDQFRWTPKGNVYLSAKENRLMTLEHVKKCCQMEIDYCDGVDKRVAENDPDLVGWEA